jgi:hypothetical protein
MNKITTSLAITAAGIAAAMTAALAITLPATAASRSSSPPPVGSVKVTGPLQRSTILYRTKLASPRALNASTSTSINWSGYAITATSGNTIKRIQAVFNVPSINCAASTLGSNGTVFSQWAGLDGFSSTSHTVEQAGVAAECSSATSPPTYFAFWEMFPNPGVTFSGISPGDAVVVIVQRVSAGWELVLQDRTTKGGFSTVQSCPKGSTCQDANAEQIMEDFNGSVPDGVNLADFGVDNQTDLLATSGSGRNGSLNSCSLWTSSMIDLVNGADHMATPGPLYGGQAFLVSWIASS